MPDTFAVTPLGANHPYRSQTQFLGSYRRTAYFKNSLYRTQNPSSLRVKDFLLIKLFEFEYFRPQRGQVFKANIPS